MELFFYSWTLLLKDVGKPGCSGPGDESKCPTVGTIIDRAKEKIASLGFDSISTMRLVKEGPSNFSLYLPIDITVDLPPISLDALGRLVPVPGLKLDTDGYLDVRVRVAGGFNITGVVFVMDE